MVHGNSLYLSIAGAGNVGSYLAIELFKAGCTIRQVLNRTIEKAEKLAQKVDANAIDNPESINPDIDVLILALPDREIVEFCRKAAIIFPDVILASTAGSVEISQLIEVNSNCGVLYPLQSFTVKTHPTPSIIPFCIEGATTEIANKLTKIASLISNDVREISSDKRLLLHLSAVFASNFSNHMMAKAYEIIRRSGLEFDILWPLVNETVSRLRSYEPLEMQTGPAIRNDRITIEKHLDMLKSYDDEMMCKLYSLISESINGTKS
jgi:predicted short-subunit dehydrogenase-like oxidoreductase (DUF2520 family)